MSFRYYLYISDSKVDMLLPQIDPALTQRRSAEVSVNLKIFGVKRGTDLAGANRIARLERVVRHLEDHGDLGSVDAPGQFFWGLLPMQWRLLGGADGPALVFLGGRTERTVVGLGGSRKHLLGSDSEPPLDSGFAASLMPSLLTGLATDPEISELLGAETTSSLDEADAAALRAVRWSVTNLRGPAQQVEFIAKRLLYGPSPHPDRDPHNGMSVLLGSPLYVALVD